MEPNNDRNTITPSTPSVPDVETPPVDVTPPLAVASVLQRDKLKTLLEWGTLVLRSLVCLFSFLAFVIMVSNNHGGAKFSLYESYEYLAAISAFVFVYSLLQVFRQAVKQFGGGKDLWSNNIAAIFDFAGDQVMSYLMISALSAALPSNILDREGGDTIFTSSTSASISMAFFAFVALALTTLISGHKLYQQTSL